MWRCLDCKHFTYSPFIYYGGLTGYDPETLSCAKDHLWITDFDVKGLKKANIIGENCRDFLEVEDH